MIQPQMAEPQASAVLDNGPAGAYTEEDIAILTKAAARLDCLKTSDLVELKSLMNPPCHVLTICNALMVCLGIQEQGWNRAKQMMADKNALLQALKNYDKDNVPSRTIKTLERDFFSNEELTLENVRNQSCAAGSLYEWVRGLYEYCRLLAKIRQIRGISASRSDQSQSRSPVRQS